MESLLLLGRFSEIERLLSWSRGSRRLWHLAFLSLVRRSLLELAIFSGEARFNEE